MNRLVVIFSALFCLAAAADEAGDAQNGKTLYTQTCLVCHGPGGASQVPTQPILAAQHEAYTAEQLKMFRDGERQNAVMAGFAKDLGDQDIADIAAYLAAQPPVIAGAADMPLARSAEKLYRGGDLARQLPACAACHLPAGEGVLPLYPRLSGQHAAYTASSLRAFASGERKNAVMNDIARKLNEEEIQALAEYISGLAP